MPLHSLKVGSHGTHNALGVAKFKRARFLLASTSEVYGDPQVHPQPETYWGHVNPIGPRGVYDEAKRYAEALTMAYRSQQGVDTAIVRIFNTYGPRMRPNDGRAIPTFVRQALAQEPVTVFGDGSQTRSFCYVDDLVRGLILLAESDEHLPVNLGNPEERTLLELVLAAPPAAPASRYLQLGLFDDTQILYGNPDKVFPMLQSLQTQVIRTDLWWGGPTGVARRKPTNPTNPNDRAYDWSTYDRTVEFASTYGMKVVFSILGTP